MSSIITIKMADNKDREKIYRIRHEIYAEELGQHHENDDGILMDDLDKFNCFIVAVINNEIAGFISVTPPGHYKYSMDKYISRDKFPIPADDNLYEIRLLTVRKKFRKTKAALLLMYSAFKWIEYKNGINVMAIGRVEVLDIYLKSSLQSHGIRIKSGKVNYELLTTTVERLQNSRYVNVCRKLKKYVNWQMPMDFHKPAKCFHGGSFFDSIGTKFNTLEKFNEIINADVLDAWFPPSPMVEKLLEKHFHWIARTSPPIYSEGLIEKIAEIRGIPVNNIITGAGSSFLMFLALPRIVTSKSNVLILDPTYGEYIHILENIIECNVDRFILKKENNYSPDIHLLKSKIMNNNYDLVIFVNPNSPTGIHIDREIMEDLLKNVPASTLVWIDETYTEYVGNNQSLEKFSVKHQNIIICKSMSKVYALSGLRAAYLCADPDLINKLKFISPPWIVSLPGQIAACAALDDTDYYEKLYKKTHENRNILIKDLSKIENIEIKSGIINAVLCHLDKSGIKASQMVEHCRKNKLHIRDIKSMGTNLGDYTIRIAVKDEIKNKQIVNIISEKLIGKKILNI